jgi:benzodiazapine receptor
MVLRVIILLAINFTALGVGGFFTGKGVPSDWYQNLNKAPWTPPGWMFGAAWSLIMICFSIYMAYLWKALDNYKMVILLFTVQWILNVSWNPAFFYYHNAILGLILIVSLTMVVIFFLANYWSLLRVKSLLVAPYFIWLLIATSLNAYIILNN